MPTMPTKEQALEWLKKHGQTRMPSAHLQARDRVLDGLGDEYTEQDVVEGFWDIRGDANAVRALVDEWFPGEDNTDVVADILFYLQGLDYQVYYALLEAEGEDK